jgi:uridine phosphorylase
MASWRREYDPLTVIRLGTSGSPQPDVKLGSLAITSYAIGLDNTGMYYPARREDEGARRLMDRIYSSGLRNVRPYVSKAHPNVVEALAKAAKRLGLEFYMGITSSASGFYGPQGRQVGRLAEILVPDLQAILADIRVKEGVDEIRVVNNEMESSLLNRICEILDYRSGSVCAILAKRKTGEFLDSVSYRRSIMNCIQVGLEAMVDLHDQKA